MIAIPSKFGWRQQIRWDYTATGAIVPSFQVNTMQMPYQVGILKGIRFNAWFLNAAANNFQMLAQGWSVVIGGNNIETIPLAQATSGGGTSPGAALGTFPEILFTIGKENHGKLLECEYLFNQRQINTITINPFGDRTIAMPVGSLVALNDQVRIDLDLFFDVVQ